MQRFQRACVGVLLLAAVVLAGRLAWVASSLETAPGLLSVLFRNASLGWIGLGHQPISTASGREQAEFWQAEAERIVGAEPTGQLALGAALMLDQSTEAWGASSFVHPCPWFHRAAQYHSQKEFEKLATGDSLRWAERATQLDDRPEVWRCRAGLLFLNPFFHAIQKPRTGAWRSILTMAEQHDPGNGLYAALAANTYWNESLERKSLSNWELWVVADEAGNAEAMRRFQQALDAPFLTGSPEYLPIVFEFLKRSCMPKHEAAEILGQRLNIKINYNINNFWLCSTLAQRHLERAQAASGPEKLQLLRECGQLLNQVANFDHLCAPGFLQVLDNAMADRAFPAFNKSVGEMSSDEVNEIKAQLQRIRTKLIVAQNARTMPSFVPMSSRAADNFCYSLAVGHAWPLVFLFGLIAVAISVLAWLLGTAHANSRWRHAMLRHVGCWLSAALISFVLFGIVPGQLIDFKMQETVAALAGVLLVIAILGSLLLAVVLTRRSQRGMLVILVVMLFLGALPARLHLGLQGWTFDGRSVIPTVEPINPAFEAMSRSPWAWAVVQWCTYPGPLVTIGLALTLIAVWRWHCTWRQGKAHASRWSCSTRASLVEIRSSAWAIALLSLVFFLVVAPDLLTESEANYQAVVSWYRQYPERRAAYLAAVEAIQNDPAQMAMYRREAQEGFQLSRAGLPPSNSTDSGDIQAVPTPEPATAD